MPMNKETNKLYMNLYFKYYYDKIKLLNYKLGYSLKFNYICKYSKFET